MSPRAIDASDGGGPHRFDPGQRARDHTRKRSRRGHGKKSRTPERRIEQLETWAYLNASVAIQAPSNTLLEVVETLPEPSYLDIGRQIILRSPLAIHDILYVGMQLADGTVAWIQWTSIYEEVTTPPFASWASHAAGGFSPLYVSSAAATIAYSRATGSINRYTRSGGAITNPVPGFPPSGTPQGIYHDGSSYWVASPFADRVYYYDGSTTLTSPSAADYHALCFDAISNALFATNFTTGVTYKLNKTTLAILDTSVADAINPQGVATDSTGKVYVADTGQNRIIKYTATLDTPTVFGTAGSADGQFNAPKGLAFDASDRLYVADSGNDRIQVFTTGGTFIAKFGGSGSGAGQLSGPVGIGVSGNLIDIADVGNNRLSLWVRN